jgi:hypothetical protein
MLLWLSQLDEARRQLRQAARIDGSPLAREAKRVLTRLEDVQKPE